MGRKSTMVVLDTRRDEVLKLLAKGVPAEVVAEKFGVSRRTLFRWLQRQGITIRELQEQYKREQEEKRKLKLQKGAYHGAIPEKLDDFIESIQEVKDFVNWLRARRVQTWRDIARTLHRTCLRLGVHPLALLQEDMIKEIEALIAEMLETKSKWTVEQFKSHLRLWYKYNRQVPPPVLSLERYKSAFAQHAWFDVEDRYKIMLKLYELPPEHFGLLRAVVLFTFYTGSRAEALTNVRFEERKIDIGGKRVRTVIAITREKGRHGKKQWEKPIKPWIYDRYIKDWLPINTKKLNIVRQTLKSVYAEVLQDDTIKKEYALKHPLHIWRHTSAMSMLHATDWNVGLVADILGWESPEILYSIYGRMPVETKIAVAYGLDIKKPPFEYVYGRWAEDLKEKRILDLEPSPEYL